MFVPCGGLSWLHVSVLLHVKYTISYRIVCREKQCGVGANRGLGDNEYSVRLTRGESSNNSTNNNNNSKTMFMVLSSWQSHCESSPGSFDECRTAPSGYRPKTKLDDLGCEFASTGCQSLHPPPLFIIITQPES